MQNRQYAWFLASATIDDMKRAYSIFGLFVGAYFLSYFFRTANAVIAPDLARDLDLAADQLGLMTSLFFASFAAIQLPLGLGLDRWGPRWVTPGLMLVGALGSLLFGLGESFVVVALGRALIGVGMGGILMGALRAFGEWFPPQRFATISGVFVGVGSLGALAAATPLAWLNDTWGWRTIFVGGAVLTAVSAVSVMLFTRNTPPGVPWRSSAGGTGGLGQIFRDLRYWRLVPLNAALNGTLLALQGLWAGPYLYDAYGLQAIEVGSLLLLLSIGATIGYTVSGWLADRFGMSRVIAVMSTIFVLSQVALALRPTTALLPVLLPVLGLCGAANVAVLAQARQIFPPALSGRALTAVNLFGFSGAFALQWLMGLVISRFPPTATGAYPPVAYSAALALTAALSLIALLWYIPLLRPLGAPVSTVASAPTE
jgi:nitrate/nitrite transporter NarK